MTTYTHRERRSRRSLPYHRLRRPVVLGRIGRVTIIAAPDEMGATVYYRSGDRRAYGSLSAAVREAERREKRREQ